jgi:hypothetical protein
MDSLEFRLRVYVVVLFVVMVLGIAGFMSVENLSLVDALYFSIVTIATVGYGDIHPATPLGKLLTMVVIITGVGTFLGVIANATEMLLNRREKWVRMQKLHMVIGLFFSEVGTTLLGSLLEFDRAQDEICNRLLIKGTWSEEEFSQVARQVKDHSYAVDTRHGRLEPLRTFLEAKAAHLLRMLENPYLLEHEDFTELLRAVFHLRDELLHRGSLQDLPESDHKHLAGDIKRAYRLLVQEWLGYMKYLQAHYPYLFSLAMRTNPFDRNASVVVR